ncbi:SHOCT domain-containing protein [Streptomyces sp. WAC00263]|jgi:putative membrane protein|uniref:SHOCT domain-containing protein n=1 Tax=Streptomyces sp. WAC00263 TaxID=1917422 RepID=UPI0009C8D951|nr:SHOCT domain-containing protein [Streptomyces sp. WAC00263]
MYWNWNSNHMNGWGWLAISLSMVLFWALLIAVGVLLFRALSRGSADTHTRASRTTPEQLLAERFARGELDEDEYRRRLAVLRSDSPDRTKYSP